MHTHNTFKHLVTTFTAEEDGATLVEFVVVLPVFMIIMVGIFNFAEINRNSVQVKMDAADSMWTQAMDKQNTTVWSQYATNPINTNPQLAAVAAAPKLLKNKRSVWNTGRAGIKNLNMAAKSSKGESKSMAKLAGHSSATPWDGSQETFTKRMTDDDRMRILPRGRKGLQVFNLSVPVSLIGTRHAMAAGTRYGMVQGSSTRNSTINHLTYDTYATYDVLLSPVSIKGKGFFNPAELITRGFSRLAAEEDDCLKSVLSITNKFDWDC